MSSALHGPERVPPDHPAVAGVQRRAATTIEPPVGIARRVAGEVVEHVLAPRGRTQIVTPRLSESALTPSTDASTGWTRVEAIGWYDTRASVMAVTGPHIEAAWFAEVA